MGSLEDSEGNLGRFLNGKPIFEEQLFQTSKDTKITHSFKELLAMINRLVQKQAIPRLGVLSTEITCVRGVRSGVFCFNVVPNI